MRKITFLTGVAAGYVLGARAGRERYEQISRTAQRVMSNPKVQQTTEAAKAQAAGLASTAKEQASGLAGSAKDKVTAKREQGSDTTAADVTVLDIAAAEGFGAPAEDSVFVVDLNNPVASGTAQPGSNDRMGL